MNFILGMYMRYGKRKNPIVFGGGQRSSGVTGGQTLKILLTRYLKIGSVDELHTWYVDALWLEEEPYCFWWRSKVIWGHWGSNSENLVNTISQGRKLGWISYVVGYVINFIETSMHFCILVI